MKKIDCRGLACPAPVIATRKAIAESDGMPFKVLLDLGAARENVLRFCKSKGCTVTEELGETSTALIISSPVRDESSVNTAAEPASPVILITSDRLGSGADELGRLLMKNFIITLLELDQLPEKMLFMNSGVLLTAEGSELVEPLIKLADLGVEVLSCGVCLEYYGVSQKLAAGRVTNMHYIAESLLASGNVVRL